MEKKTKVMLIAIGGLVLSIMIFLGVKAFSNSPATTNYVVSFNTDGGTFIEAKLVEKNGKVSKPNDPIKAGLNFAGWFVEEKEFNFDSEVTKNMILVAKWETPPVPTYAVLFDSDGGSAVDAQSVIENGTVKKPSNPTKSGLEFVSWQLNGKDYDFDSKVTENITLKATWQTPDNRLTVSFNSNGGKSVASQKVEPGSTAKKPSNPTRNGYTFVEWQLNGSAYNFNTAITKSITLKAVWKENPIVYTYSVKWEAVANSVIGEYKMYVLRSDGTKVAGQIKVNYSEGGSDTFNVSTSGYQIVKAIVGSALVVSPTS